MADGFGLTGIAANQSIATGALIDVDRLLQKNGIDLTRPSQAGSRRPTR